MVVGNIKSNTLVRLIQPEHDAENSESMREFMLHDLSEGSEMANTAPKISSFQRKCEAKMVLPENLPRRMTL